MTDTKFTKGEWAVVKGDITKLEYNYLITMGGKVEFGFDDSFNSQYEHQLNKGETESNAHLIASAPSLYGEIQTDIDKLKLKLKFKTGNDEAKLLIELDISRKESLLSKARGELT